MYFGLVYTAGAWANQSTRIFTGIFADKFGIKVSVAVGASIVAVGQLLFAFSSEDTGDFLLPGFICVAVGGPMIQVSVQKVAVLFENQATVVSSLTTASAFCSVWYMGVNYLNDYLDVSYQPLFVILAGLAICVLISSLMFWPKKIKLNWIEFEDENGRNPSYPNPDYYDHTSLLKPVSVSADRPSFLQETMDFKTATVWELVFTWEYAFMVLYSSVFILFRQWYLMTVDTQTAYYTGEDLDTAFGIVFTICSVYAFAVGWIIDKFGFGVMSLLNMLSGVACGEFLSNGRLNQYVGFVFYVLYDVGVFGLFFAYIGVNFGYKYFGTLSGLGMLFSAFVTLFEYLCLHIVENGLLNDYGKMDKILVYILVAVGTPFTIWVWWRECKINRSKMKKEKSVQARDTAGLRSIKEGQGSVRYIPEDREVDT